MSPLSETLEWSTDVLAAEEAEQRIALRSQPRATLTLTHRLDAEGIADAAERARADPLSDWTLPLWHLARPATAAISTSDTEVAVDTTDGVFAAASHAAIAADGGEAHLVEVSAIQSDRLVLATAAGVDLVHPIVMPVGTGYMSKSLGIDRRRQGLGTLTATFGLRPPGVGSASSGLPQHEGLDVLTDPAVLRQPLAETIGQSHEAIDNGFGPVVLERVLSWVQRSSTITLIDRGSARLTRRRWLLSLRGRQRAFWLPGWGRELVLQAAVGSGDTSIHVSAPTDPGDLVGRHLMFDRAGGPIFREIEAAAWDALGLRLDIAAPGVSIGAETPVHLLVKVRSDTDRIELSHAPNRSEFSMTLTEIPQ